MAENVTPVVLKVKDFADREVMLVDYKFNTTGVTFSAISCFLSIL